MKIFIIISLFVLASCQGLQTNSHELEGKWECYHEELEDGTTRSTDIFTGEEFEYTCKGQIFDLKSGGTGWESLSEQNFKYSLKDSILSLGIRFYIVESLNKKEMTLLDYDPNESYIFRFRRKYKRLE